MGSNYQHERGSPLYPLNHLTSTDISNPAYHIEYSVVAAVHLRENKYVAYGAQDRYIHQLFFLGSCWSRHGMLFRYRDLLCWAWAGHCTVLWIVLARVNERGRGLSAVS